MAEFLAGVKEKYPAALLKGRTMVEGNVIACLMKDMLLMQDVKLEPKNFLTTDGMFYFKLLQDIVVKGYNSLDEITILSSVSETMREQYENRGGWESIQHLIDVINVDNFETYLDILYRENILISMYNDGFNLLKEIDINGKKVVPLKLLRKLTATECVEWYEAKLSTYEIANSSNVLEEEELDLDDDFIDACIEGENNGVPFETAGLDINLEEINCFPFLSKQINGILEGTLSMLGGYSSVGKALTVDSDVMTPNGYVKMGKIKIGDAVIGDDGKQHNVIGVFPQGEKDIYRVTFNDDTYVDCCEDHLWTVITQHDKCYNGRWRTVALKDIIEGKLKYKYNTKSGTKYNLSIPMCKPVEFNNNAYLPIDPYALGLLIGDGSTVNGIPKFTNPEEDVVNMLRERLGERYAVNCCSTTRGYEYNIADLHKEERVASSNGVSRVANGLKINLINIGLWGKTAKDKFIPDIYKYSSVENRIEILSGLIDTDGEVRKNLFTFSSKSKQLILDIKFIVESLGGTCTWNERYTKYTNQDGSRSKPFLSYRCHFKLPSNIIPVKSKKHLSQYCLPDKTRGCEPCRTIWDIQHIGKKECQCIKIDSPTELFLTNNCIVTHNSTWWITTLMGLLEQDRKILIISNEENINKYKIKFLVWIIAKYQRYYKVTKKKVMSGDISDEHREIIREAQRYWRENYKGRVKFIAINDSDMGLIKKKIRENVLRYAYDTVLYDTFKIQENDMSAARTDLSLVRDSRELDKLAKKYNLIMLASVQLAENTKGTLFLTSSVLSNSKQTKEVTENLLLMRNVYAEELDSKSKYYIKPFRLKKVDNKWIEEPYECDPNRVYRILFVEKCRSGMNSSDTGVAYLLAYAGDHCVFREVAQCRPKHGRID